MIKVMMAAVVVLGTAGAAMADGSCTATAMDKKLAGAAKASFLRKCQTDAAKSCDSQAMSKKLAGAAKASFTRKCVSDSVGT